MKLSVPVCIALFTSCYAVSEWSGNIETKQEMTKTLCPNTCKIQVQWGCNRDMTCVCVNMITTYQCKPGWRHIGDKNCSVPICYPGCNGGHCISPNQCECPPNITGQFCQTLTCSHDQPCYPGNCMNVDQCNCTVGFSPNTGSGIGRCLKMGDEYKPYIGRATATISNLRVEDQTLIYSLQVDGDAEDVTTYIVWSGKNKNNTLFFQVDDSEDTSNVLWSNQMDFNTLSFMFESLCPKPVELQQRPFYVDSFKMGIVHGAVDIGVTGDLVSKSKQRIECSSEPDLLHLGDEIFVCNIVETELLVNINHGDTLNVTFSATSGGFRQLIRTEDGTILPIDTITGPSSSKETFFKFDFIVPMHCSEADSAIACSYDDDILAVKQEFTKNPIEVYWKGWHDDQNGSGMWFYYLELHKLIMNEATQHLTEEDPIGPMDSFFVMHTDGIISHTFTPDGPGAYSVLFDARDKANNSRIARRIVIYDPDSNITLNSNGLGLHVTTATKVSNFLWQSDYDTATGSANLTVSWKELFHNLVHETGKYLNPVDDFPVQFTDLQDIAISTLKFVESELDDHTGNRTLVEVSNIHGIITFEYGIGSDDGELPPSEWIPVEPLSNTISFEVAVYPGELFKIWVRAHDAMGNIRTESTRIGIDITAPNVDDGSIQLTLNDDSLTTPFTFPSRIDFDAFDEQSGIKTMTINVNLHTPGKPDKVFNTTVPASLGDDPSSLDCYPTGDHSLCFISRQTVLLDNCWFMTPSSPDLINTTATINVIVNNQAGLTHVINFTIDNVADLHGLDFSMVTEDEFETIDENPLNLRIEDLSQTSFRVVWDHQENVSCYANADIIITLRSVDCIGQPSFELSSSNTFIEFGGLQPGNTYDVTFQRRLGGGGTTDGVTLSVVTIP